MLPLSLSAISRLPEGSTATPAGSATGDDPPTVIVLKPEAGVKMKTDPAVGSATYRLPEASTARPAGACSPLALMAWVTPRTPLTGLNMNKRAVFESEIYSTPSGRMASPFGPLKPNPPMIDVLETATDWVPAVNPPCDPEKLLAIS